MTPLFSCNSMLPDELAWEWLMEDISEERITELATYQISASELDAYTGDFADIYPESTLG